MEFFGQLYSYMWEIMNVNINVFNYQISLAGVMIYTLLGTILVIFIKEFFY